MVADLVFDISRMTHLPSMRSSGTQPPAQPDHCDLGIVAPHAAWEDLGGELGRRS